MKVKIPVKEILDLCNLKHPDFGTFAKFLGGLTEGRCLIVEGEILEEEGE